MGAEQSQSLELELGKPDEERYVSDTKHHELVLATFRCFIADLVQKHNGGHPGGAMGMAAIGVALWSYVMRYSPLNPSWFNRDRFVLSNGHCCVFQYMFLHLTGYKAMTMDQLLSYHSTRLDGICPGHPEIEIEGIEVTTGPLGQGVANAVGLAMASAHLGATYNRPGFEVVNNMTYCMVGDACLQEGVALEAISLAGHWRLHKLVIIYDNNQITCDGSVDLTNTENVNDKMKACGWNVIDVEDGCYDITGIVNALNAARSSDRPTFINVRTIIGLGSVVAGQAQAHGVAFGAEDVANIKRYFKMDPDAHFLIPTAVREFFAPLVERGQRFEQEYKELLAQYEAQYPELAQEFALRRNGDMTGDWRSLIPKKDELPTTPTPSRASGGLICNPLAQNINTFMVGTADLSPSVNMIWKDKRDFQHEALRTACGINGDYSGRYIHWGVREHAMASVSNGLSAFNPGTIYPITSSFFIFYIYAAPGIRMGALQRLPQIHIATHDSIGTGEDGPTHQPIALAALYRAMPNIFHIRPCDSEETAGAFALALSQKSAPSIISLSRQSLLQYPAHTSREGVQRGAYIFREAQTDHADVTLLGVGSEITFVVEAADILQEAYGAAARIVSFPCQRAFESQPIEYKRRVLRYRSTLVVAVEAYATNGWERYADAGYGMKSFGRSLPGKDTYAFFGFEGGKIADRVWELVKEVRRDGLGCLRGEFRDLNTDGYWEGLE